MKHLTLILISLIAISKGPLFNSELVLCDMSLPSMAYSTYGHLANITANLLFLIYELSKKYIIILKK